MNYRIIISGGGTGGHIFPALAIADAIKSTYKDADILFVGAKDRMEMTRVPAAGYDIIGLDIQGIRRSSFIKNIFTLYKLIKSLFYAFWVIRKFKPHAAIGVGGYASGPTLKIASWLGVPTYIQEQNSYAGVTNKWLARKAKAVFVAYPDMAKYFGQSTIIQTGNPIRKDIMASSISKSDACKILALDPQKPVVFVFGGSLGAGVLNGVLSQNYKRLEEDDSVQWVWQTGIKNFEEVSRHCYPSAAHIKVMPFIDDMLTVYHAADLVVCRAGALTISELAVLGKASILVPSPHVAEDHQTKNALALVDQKAAVMIQDNDVDISLLKEIYALLADDNYRQQLQSHIKSFARPNATEDIVSYIFSSLNKNI